MISCICRHIYLCLNIYYLLDSVDERNHVVVTWGILWRHIKLQNWIRKSHTISCVWALKHYNTEVSNVPAPDDTWEVVITPLWNVFPTGNWKHLEQLRWAALGSVTCWARHQIKLQTMAFWSFCKMHSYSELSPPTPLSPFFPLLRSIIPWTLSLSFVPTFSVSPQATPLIESSSSRRVRITRRGTNSGLTADHRLDSQEQAALTVKLN